MDTSGRFFGSSGFLFLFNNEGIFIKGCLVVRSEIQYTDISRTVVPLILKGGLGSLLCGIALLFLQSHGRCAVTQDFGIHGFGLKIAFGGIKGMLRLFFTLLGWLRSGSQDGLVFFFGRTAQRSPPSCGTGSLVGGPAGVTRTSP